MFELKPQERFHIFFLNSIEFLPNLEVQTLFEFHSNNSIGKKVHYVFGPFSIAGFQPSQASRPSLLVGQTGLAAQFPVGSLPPGLTVGAPASDCNGCRQAGEPRQRGARPAASHAGAGLAVPFGIFLWHRRRAREVVGGLTGAG
jgi:hypothetical protein